MIDPKSKFKILISIESFLVALSLFAIFYEVIGIFLSNSKMNGWIVGLSLFVLVFVGIHMLLKIYVMVPIQVKITYKDTLLYLLPSEYCLLPTKEHLPQRKSKWFQVNRHSDSTETNRPVCSFHAQYYDVIKSKLVEYQCREDVLDTGFCMFHDNYYINGKEIEIGNVLNEKINKLIDDGQEVICIGYNIPFISVTEKTIRKPIYFHGANIRIADFRGSVFTNNAIVYFVHTSFEEASFGGTIFEDQALFNNSRFIRISKRPGFFYKWEENYDFKNKFSGFVNFSNSRFYKPANFNSTEFYGIVMFDNTEYFDDAIFSNSIFYVDTQKSSLDKASFHSSLSTICMIERKNIIPTGE